MEEDDLLPVRNIRYGPPKASLKNANIESGLRNTLVPAILQCCTVVAVRSIFDFSTYPEAVKQLAARRKQIEDQLLKMDAVWFIVSAVTGITEPGKKKKEREGDTALDATAESTESEDGKLFPGIALWVAFSVPSCLIGLMESTIVQMVQSSGLSPLLCKKINGRRVENAEEKAAKSLCRVLKDFNWNYAVTLSRDSAESFLRSAIPGANDVTISSWAPEFGKNVVRILISQHCEATHAERIRTELQRLGSMLSELQYDFVDMQASSSVTEKAVAAPSVPTATSKLMEVINLMNYVMKKTGKRFLGGIIVGKDPRSTSAFTRETSVRDFLNELCEADVYKDTVTPQIDKVVNFFKNNPKYGGIAKIKVDFNLIEVRDGWFFNISEKTFVQNAIEGDDIGEITPRKFFPYTYSELSKPYVKEYADSVLNSFPEDGLRKLFLQMLYQLLLTGQWPFKRKKMVMTGPHDSGKSTWLEPILEVIDRRHLATCTDEKKFSCQMINNDTQLVWLDEWIADVKKVSEYKRLFQGGVQFFPIKFSIASVVEYNSGLYVTCNELPDFGQGADGLAMQRRMHVFKCSTIPNCRTGFEVMFRQRAMEIIHWIATETDGMPLFDDHDIQTNFDEDEDEQRLMLAAEEDDTPSVPEFYSLDLSNMRYVDESILPRRSIVRAHLDVYDSLEEPHLPPYRLFSGYDVASEDYHRSVYLNIQDFSRSVDVNNGIDHETLFTNRYEQSWSGTDSLYHAWLLVNHGRTPKRFSMRTFAQRYPDWKMVKLAIMDLSPTSFGNSSTSTHPSQYSQSTPVKREDASSLPPRFMPPHIVKDVIELDDDDEVREFDDLSLTQFGASPKLMAGVDDIQTGPRAEVQALVEVRDVVVENEYSRTEMELAPGQLADREVSAVVVVEDDDLPDLGDVPNLEFVKEVAMTTKNTLSLPPQLNDPFYDLFDDPLDVPVDCNIDKEVRLVVSSLVDAVEEMLVIDAIKVEKPAPRFVGTATILGTINISDDEEEEEDTTPVMVNEARKEVVVLEDDPSDASELSEVEEVAPLKKGPIELEESTGDTASSKPPTYWWTMMEPLSAEQTNGRDLMAEVRSVITSLVDAVEERMVIAEMKVEQHLPRFIPDSSPIQMICISDSEEEAEPNVQVGYTHPTDCEGKQVRSKRGINVLDIPAWESSKKVCFGSEEDYLSGSASLNAVSQESSEMECDVQCVVATMIDAVVDVMVRDTIKEEVPPRFVGQSFVELICLSDDD